MIDKIPFTIGNWISNFEMWFQLFTVYQPDTMGHFGFRFWYQT